MTSLLYIYERYVNKLPDYGPGAVFVSAMYIIGAYILYISYIDFKGGIMYN